MLPRFLTQFAGEILPTNSDREIKAIRKKFGLSRDVLRHTFVSMHIGAFKSFADAALESGNTEKIIRDHYLNTSSFKDAQAFWQLAPGRNTGKGTKSVAGTKIALGAKDCAERPRSTRNSPTRLGVADLIQR